MTQIMQQLQSLIQQLMSALGGGNAVGGAGAGSSKH